MYRDTEVKPASITSTQRLYDERRIKVEMKYSMYEFSNLNKGQIIEVTLSNAANVRLMNSSNFLNFKNGKRHKYYGGYVNRSPYKIPVPASGHWYLTIDLGGYSGSVRHSARVLPGMLQPALSNRPLTQEENIYIADEDEGKEYDVFISHASEDKDAVVRQLAIELATLGLKVWYDEFELKIGDSLRRKIDMGLARSRFGVVVISRNFIKKGWTNYALDGLVTRAVSGQQALLPIWHEITKQEVIDYSPSLADKVARSTSQYTVTEIAKELSELIKSKGKESVKYSS